MSESVKGRAALRALPAVDHMLAWEELHSLPRNLVVRAIRHVLDQTRTALLDDDHRPLPARPVLAQLVIDEVTRSTATSVRPVINATGVLLHTNLGRAPLADAAVAAVEGARAATTVELDLESGRRGPRAGDLHALLAELSGAEASLVVNNCAAAVLLAITALARDGDVVVSRGELVEIGGSFRVPDVIARGGGRLREVGTTNRTRAADYRDALGPETRVLLKTHRSNFSIVGFTESTSVDALVSVAKEADGDVLVVYDLGAATFLPLRPDSTLSSPTPVDATRAGADLVCFSGDKLLGGPQAGLMVGTAAVIERCRRDPLYRALRPGKLTFAALDATLRLHLAAERDALPLHRAAAWSMEEMRQRAESLVARVPSELRERIEIVESEATLGGGSIPGETIASIAIAVNAGASDETFARALRCPAEGLRPVVGRTRERQVMLDLRTVLLRDDDALLLTLTQALRKIHSDVAS